MKSVGVHFELLLAIVDPRQGEELIERSVRPAAELLVRNSTATPTEFFTGARRQFR
jgi:hypothetical protein